MFPGAVLGERDRGRALNVLYGLDCLACATLARQRLPSKYHALHQVLSWASAKVGVPRANLTLVADVTGGTPSTLNSGEGII